ncbi:hypothetical protein GMDG_07976 [Pseudogymnoascus destructans 20631-21]|uniref:Uncharacterized protein n=1 Tax=Pseudogymnoascus destructans (strain ATCC MYA-4855 / 20631-21) TaxID=658429 RepID=L8G384_PSED2|nr:hypothetical protein GMDG_07976 [Pseudogymnoascus destructans 20631-21]
MSRAAAAAANAAAHTAAERVLHIRAHPTPVTMAARQRVLVALESFGEVEHFRSLKHHPTTPTTSAFHAILPPTASRALLAASPLTIPLTQPAPESQSPGPYQENLTLTIRPSPHLPPSPYAPPQSTAPTHPPTPATPLSPQTYSAAYPRRRAEGVMRLGERRAAGAEGMGRWTWERRRALED